MKAKNRMYEMIIDGGDDNVFKVRRIGMSKKDVMETYSGNGDYISVKDVTDDYPINTDYLYAELKNFGEVERNAIVRLVQNYYSNNITDF